MTDIEKLKQEAEEAKSSLMLSLESRGWITDSESIADAIISATIAQIALQAAEREAEPNIEGQIISEIYKACELLGAKSDLLGTIGSWRDTMTDENTLDALRHLNQHYSKPAPIADDTWMPWDGKGDCPVSLNADVIVRFSSGLETHRPDKADAYYWTHDGDSCDIIAYRIITPAADRVSES